MYLIKPHSIVVCIVLLLTMFATDAHGSDVSTGLKYSVPMNSGRWGYVKGDYRYLTYKQNYGDARMVDTAMDGGFLQMGFVF
ncbi:MAG: hypothetical protein ACLP5H_21755 [Desulfomonilaceae bacterium]